MRVITFKDVNIDEVEKPELRLSESALGANSIVDGNMYGPSVISSIIATVCGPLRPWRDSPPRAWPLSI
jgi:hypothetical protein